MDLPKAKLLGYLALLFGLLAVLLGCLRLSGYVPDSLVSQAEAVLGLPVGVVTVLIGVSSFSVQ